MKQLTKKQKIDFCIDYLNYNHEKSKWFNLMNNYICLELSREIKKLSYEEYFKLFRMGTSSIFPKKKFSELHLFNPNDKDWFGLVIDKNETNYRENNKLRLTIISFVLAILESE